MSAAEASGGSLRRRRRRRLVKTSAPGIYRDSDDVRLLLGYVVVVNEGGRRITRRVGTFSKARQIGSDHEAAGVRPAAPSTTLRDYTDQWVWVHGTAAKTTLRRYRALRADWGETR